MTTQTLTQRGALEIVVEHTEERRNESRVASNLTRVSHLARHDHTLDGSTVLFPPARAVQYPARLSTTFHAPSVPVAPSTYALACLAKTSALSSK